MTTTPSTTPLLPPGATSSRPLILLVLITALGDILFWRHTLGLSLALFSAAIFASALTVPPRPAALATLILSLLPVVEHTQPLSVAILALGLIAALALQHGTPGSALLPASLSLVRQVPVRGAQDLGRACSAVQGTDLVGKGRLIARNWTLPLGGLLILTALLAQANPVLDSWLQHLGTLPFDPGFWLGRSLFWAGMALVAWPLLVARPAEVPVPTRRPGLDPARFGLNAASVANALILFNAALALQTLLDARYLWTGATPPGMTLAAYAHRGAYPLLATALLAGAFALAARPFVTQRPLLKPLLHLWLAQNVVLTLSALYRLDLYVQAYGLTYLRAHAAIWMALVAAGLCLTLWQVARDRTARWLLLRCTALGAATLYLCAFVNFADLIARTNVAMGKIDSLYLCQLGPTAAASVPRTLWTQSTTDGFYDTTCTLTPPQIDGWRDWGFRNWRVLHNLPVQEARP